MYFDTKCGITLPKPGDDNYEGDNLETRCSALSMKYGKEFKPFISRQQYQRQGPSDFSVYKSRVTEFKDDEFDPMKPCELFTRDELVNIAQDYGLSGNGTRNDICERIRKHIIPKHFQYKIPGIKATTYHLPDLLLELHYQRHYIDTHPDMAYQEPLHYHDLTDEDVRKIQRTAKKRGLKVAINQKFPGSARVSTLRPGDSPYASSVWLDPAFHDPISFEIYSESEK